jgi:hypothetical protein
MEAIRSSETSDATKRTTRRHIPEDDTLHNHRCENNKSYKSNNDNKRNIRPFRAAVQKLRRKLKEFDNGRTLEGSNEELK